jgi:hypothetical protein
MSSIPHLTDAVETLLRAGERVVASAQQRLDSIGQVRYAGHESGSFCDSWWYIYHRRFQAHGHVRPGPRPQALIRSVRP